MELRSGNWTPCWFIAERLECNVFTPPISPCSVGTVFAHRGLRSVQHRLPKARRAQIMAGGWGFCRTRWDSDRVVCAEGDVFQQELLRIGSTAFKGRQFLESSTCMAPERPNVRAPRERDITNVFRIPSVLCTVPLILLLSADFGWFWYLISGAL